MAGLLGWNAVLNLPSVIITGRDEDEDEESYLIPAESEATVRDQSQCQALLLVESPPPRR